MSHNEEPPIRTSSFNVPLSTGDNARKKIDNPKNIGFRGRHAHGKAPDDPVYPSRQLTASPRIGFVDWRTGGRALLVAALGALEGRILKTRGQIMRWQMFPPCSPKCGNSCHKARNRILCSWFVPGSVHEHIVKMEGLLTQFKGAKNISLADPPFRPMSQVALRNKFRAVPMKRDIMTKSFVFSKLQPDPAFGLDPAVPRTSNPDGYDCDEDRSVARDDELLVTTDEYSSEEARFINSSHRI
jgi:hypothetical protein